MTAPRDRKWLSVSSLAGGLVLFITEMLVVVAVAVIAWLVSTLVLAAL
ncbi:MAG TPA: hypothetical protein VE569_04955 [Acidimicrobiia bacterium]|jgi:hypothetical protein|nr:hypothetical protein [Acidimicrobiia bacterium]